MAMGMVRLWDRFRTRGRLLQVAMVAFAASLGIYYAVQDVRGQSKWTSAEAFYSDIIEKSPATRDGRSTNAKAWASLTAHRSAAIINSYLSLRAEAREGQISDTQFRERYQEQELRAGFETIFEDADWALSLEPDRTWVMVAEPFMLSGHHLGRYHRLLERMDLVIEAKRETKALEEEIEQIERVRAMLAHVGNARAAQRQMTQDDHDREIVRTALLECQSALRYFDFREWPALNLEGFQDPGPMPRSLQIHPVVQNRFRMIAEDVLMMRTRIERRWRP
jgi:hypothetical protein